MLSATLSSSSLGEKASESSIKGGGDDVFAASAMIVASIKSGEYSRALKSVLCFATQPLSLNNNNRGEEVLEDEEFALFLAGVCGLCLHQRANACGPPLHLEEEEEEEEEGHLRI